MQFYFLNSTLAPVGAVGHVLRAAVRRRFFSPGELELFCSARQSIPQNSVYLYDAEHDVIAVLESYSRLPDGTQRLYGRSAECLLERRIIRLNGYYTGSVAGALGMVMSAYVTQATERLPVKIGNTDGLPVSAQLRYNFNRVSDWLYTTLARYGASYTLTAAERDTGFTFDVVKGQDLSPSVSERGIILREEDGDITAVRLSDDSRVAPNVLLVVGNDGRYAQYPQSSELHGIDRREGLLSARDIYPSSYSTDEAYLNALRGRGEEQLSRYRERISFTADGSCGTRRFGRDYSLGDECECVLAGGEKLKLRAVLVEYLYGNGVCRERVGFGGSGARAETAASE